MSRNSATLQTAPDIYERVWRAAWRPSDRRPPWQWLEENVTEIPYSPMPGAWKSDHSPMAREVLDMIFDPLIRTVMITAATQTAKSLILEMAIANVVANDPGPAMFLNQDDDEAGDEAATRLYPLLDAIAPVAGLMPPPHKRRKDSIRFNNGMQLWVKGANIGNLQRRSIRWMFGDEWWLWKDGFIAEAQERLRKFGWLSKGVFASQGGTEHDEGHKLIAKMRQLDWGWHCPKCGTWQPWDWNYIGGVKEGRPGLSWEHCKTADETGYDEGLVRRCTVMVCRNEDCGHRVDDRDVDRRILSRHSRFAEIQPGPMKEVSVHWNAIPFDSWGDMAVAYLRAKQAAKMGNMGELKKFYQKRLAQAWSDNPEDFSIQLEKTGFSLGDDWEDESGFSATRKGMQFVRKPFPEGKKVHPLRALLVDRQRDHFWVGVLSFSERGRARVRWLQGGLGADGVHLYEDVDAIRIAHDVHPSMTFVDARWDRNAVMLECAKRGWTALMGEDRETFPHRVRDDNGTQQVVHRYYSPVRKVPLSRRLVCRMHFFSNLNCKDTVARNLASGMWELPDDAPDQMLQSLESEQRKIVGKKPMWVQIGKRPNHYWDILSMGAAVSYMLKLVDDPSQDPPR